MNKTFIIWFAGFFDGEGSFQIKRHSVSKNGNLSLHIGMKVANTDWKALQYIQKNLGGTIYEVKRKNKNHKVLWRWSSTSTDEVQKITRQLYPYLIIKKQRAELILQFEKRNHLAWKNPIVARKNEIIWKKQMKLKDAMKEFNYRGVKV